MLTVTKLFEFEAAHQLPNHKGKCKNLHGHSYKLEVEVASDTGVNASGMIMDFGDLKKLVGGLIESKLDHMYLNESLNMEYPTAENMILSIAHLLSTRIKKPFVVVRARLWETSTSYAEWRREE